VRLRGEGERRKSFVVATESGAINQFTERLYVLSFAAFKKEAFGKE
jgi:hypothetical protein